MAMQTGYGGVYNNPNANTKLPNGTTTQATQQYVNSAATNGSPAQTQYGQNEVAMKGMSSGAVQPTVPQPSFGTQQNPSQMQMTFQPTPITPPPSSAPPGEGYGPGFGEQYGKSHIGQYDTPTMLETFAQQQLNGNNPYYDRLRQQGMDAINQQMAARGHYNSGGALAALGNFDAGLYADQFANMGNLLGSASGMGLQRMGQGQNVANSVQAQQQQRTGQQFGELSDIAHLGAGLQGGFYGQGGQLSGDAAMSGINAGANAAQLQGQSENALPNTLMQGLNTYFSTRK